MIPPSMNHNLRKSCHLDHDQAAYTKKKLQHNDHTQLISMNFKQHFDSKRNYVQIFYLIPLNTINITFGLGEQYMTHDIFLFFHR
jgi:hypothetical protein